MHPEQFVGNPILSLQTMLRTISLRHPVIPRLIPDGIFGERTLEAVMIFQREFFPPVTGHVTQPVWDAIAALYRETLQTLLPPRPGTGYPERDFVISPGQDSVHLYLIQAMFKALSNVLSEVEDSTVTGVLDESTRHNTNWIHRLNQTPETGAIDMAVWDTLARLYTIFVSRAQYPPLYRPEALRGPN